MGKRDDSRSGMRRGDCVIKRRQSPLEVIPGSPVPVLKEDHIFRSASISFLLVYPIRFQAATISESF